jgi:hypothetical protein
MAATERHDYLRDPDRDPRPGSSLRVTQISFDFQRAVDGAE